MACMSMLADVVVLRASVSPLFRRVAVATLSLKPPPAARPPCPAARRDVVVGGGLG